MKRLVLPLLLPLLLTLTACGKFSGFRAVAFRLLRTVAGAMLRTVPLRQSRREARKEQTP